MQPNELLAEVQIWRIWAIKNSETPLPCHFFNNALGSMHGSIVIQQDKPLVIVRQQGLHFTDSFWEECLEISTLNSMSENH
jgi:hypothetical protein